MSSEQPKILTTPLEVIDALGADAIMAELGVSRSSIKEAKRAPRIPANWFDGIDRLAKQKRVRIARECFNFRGAA